MHNIIEPPPFPYAFLEGGGVDLALELRANNRVGKPPMH